MNDHRQRVLYIEQASGVGGSVISLYRLVRALNRERYEPIVLLQRPSELAARFRALGVEVLVLDEAAADTRATNTSAPYRRDIAAWLMRFSSSAAHVYSELRAITYFLGNELPAALRISRIVRNRRIDLVHLNNQPNSNHSGLVAAWLNRLACVCHVRDYNPPTMLDRWLTRRIDYLVFISREMERRVQQAVPGQRGEVVYDGLDLEASETPATAQMTRKLLGLSAEDFVIGNIGRLTPWKGQDVFLRALAYARTQAPRLKALIVGEPDPPTDTAYQDQLLALTHELGLKDIVTFTGFRADVPKLISAMDVVVHSSTAPEPFGLVIIEGMACGKPVIATRAGGVLDIVEDGRQGVLVPVGDERAMAEAMIRLALNPQWTDQLGRQARQRVETHFTASQFARAIESVYQRLRPSAETDAAHPPTLSSPEALR
ncbi:MAG: glycosyltransferase family 4 protein [Anaerolineales bacterium]